MQRMLGSVSVLALLASVAGVTCVLMADDQPGPAPLRAQAPPPRLATPPAATSSPAASATTKGSADETAIRALGEAIVKAYSHHDAAAFASHFTAEGEYVDDRETSFHGREAIEK